MTVMGTDPAIKMLEITRSKPENRGIRFVQENPLRGGSFGDKEFDLAISFYVAHGLKAEDRGKLYAEMSRVAKEYVIIHDYNSQRALITSIAEWLEGGDRFHFIKNAEKEKKDCVAEMKCCFSGVSLIQIGAGANWYVWKPQTWAFPFLISCYYVCYL